MLRCFVFEFFSKLPDFSWFANDQLFLFLIVCYRALLFLHTWIVSCEQWLTDIKAARTNGKRQHSLFRHNQHWVRKESPYWFPSFAVSHGIAKLLFQGKGGHPTVNSEEGFIMCLDDWKEKINAFHIPKYASCPISERNLFEYRTQRLCQTLENQKILNAVNYAVSSWVDNL